MYSAKTIKFLQKRQRFLIGAGQKARRRAAQRLHAALRRYLAAKAVLLGGNHQFGRALQHARAIAHLKGDTVHHRAVLR